jgi:hypothetical protein
MNLLLSAVAQIASLISKSPDNKKNETLEDMLQNGDIDYKTYLKYKKK